MLDVAAVPPVFGESESQGLAKGIGWRPEQSELDTHN